MDVPSMDRLFRATQCVPELGVVVHALSDLELQERHRCALEASMRLARLLKDPNSGAYLTTVEPVLTADPPVLVVIAETGRRRKLAEEVAEEFPFHYQPFPDNASLEEQTEVLEAREAAEKALAEKRAKRLDERLTAYRAELQALPEEKLRGEALRLTQDLARNAAYSDEFIAQSIFLATETEQGQPYFASIEQARRCGRQAQDRLWDALVEVNNIDPLALKSPS